MNVTDFLYKELLPEPGRFENVMRITCLTVLVVILSELFQTPEIAYSVYLVFFISKEEKASTLFLAIACTAAVTIAVFTALGIYTISAAEPALRLPLMALIVFVAMFISRASPLGQVAFVIGFIITISLTLVDDIPSASSLSSAEILTRSVLWLWVVVMLPVSLVILANSLAGRDPVDVFNVELDKRLKAAGAVMSSGAATDAKKKTLVEYANSNFNSLLNYLKMAGIFNKKFIPKAAINKILVSRTAYLITLVNEWSALAVEDAYLKNSASLCGEQLFLLASSLFGNQDGLKTYQKISFPSKESVRVESSTSLLLSKIIEMTDDIFNLLVQRNETPSVNQPLGNTKKLQHQLLFPDAFTNPGYVRYALKATLAIFIAYITYTMLAWPEIRTCMVTAFFVSLGSVGESTHKMVLRLSGAMIGGALGLGTIIFIMPYMTTITELCFIMGCLAFLAGWVATSSERLSYAGLQMAFAFFLCTLVGYGPTIELSLARDRIIGILLGNVIVYLVFSRIWPESVGAKSKLFVSAALEQLAKMYAELKTATAEQSAEDDAAFLKLNDALSQARRLMTLDPFEPKLLRSKHVIMSISLIDTIQQLSPPALILNGPGFPAILLTERINYHESLGLWLSFISHQILNDVPKLIMPPSASLLVRELEQDSIESLDFFGPLAYADWYKILDNRVNGLYRLLKISVTQDGFELNSVRSEAL